VVSGPIYQSDPDPAPDSEFIAGGLASLVVGNRGRLLDVRRTPIAITAVNAALGEFELEVGAFEDAGARWQLPLSDVGRLQFARDAATASEHEVRALEQALARVDICTRLACDPRARAATLDRIAAARADLRGQFSLHDVGVSDLERHSASREGSPGLAQRSEAWLAHREVLELDRHLATQLVSNPASGELVKGHAIVLAELGLCEYHGAIIRNPAIFDEPWSKAQRAAHLVARLAFMSELWASLGRAHVTVYRGLASQEPLAPRPARTLISATFSEAVARSHFQGGPATHSAVLWRQRVSTDRILMTFLETPAMNGRFLEAEAVIIGDTFSS
jgi:hypothetical protein